MEFMSSDSEMLNEMQIIFIASFKQIPAHWCVGFSCIYLVLVTKTRVELN